MSCYNWESGSVKIPTAEWGKMKKYFRKLFNDYSDTLFRKANIIFERLMLEAKGKRNFNYRERLAELIYANGIRDDEDHYVFQSMFPRGKDNKKPYKPQKKAFPVARNNEYSFHQGELYVSFEEKEKVVHYAVGENNRAVERCENSMLGSCILRALRQVVFGRGSGGKFVGNDEYNRDDREDGGGGNYVTRRFGPLGDR